MENITKYMQNLTGYAYPVTIPIDGEPGRYKRCWIVRLQEVLPPISESSMVETEIMLRVNSLLQDAYGESSSDKQLIQSRVTVALVRGGDHYLVAEIGLPTHEFAIGDVAMIGTWEVLRAIDSQWTVLEIEGIPSQFWFPFRLSGR